MRRMPRVGRSAGIRAGAASSLCAFGCSHAGGGDGTVVVCARATEAQAPHAIHVLATITVRMFMAWLQLQSACQAISPRKFATACHEWLPRRISLVLIDVVRSIG
jgi:hypothetical protein